MESVSDPERIIRSKRSMKIIQKAERAGLQLLGTPNK